MSGCDRSSCVGSRVLSRRTYPTSANFEDSQARTYRQVFADHGSATSNAIGTCSLVRLWGLLAAPHLNGVVGHCEQWDWAASRWRVRLLAGDVKSVRQENLIVIEEEVVPRGQHCRPREAAHGGREREHELDPIDGEPLTEEDLEAIAAEEAAAAKAARSERKRLARPFFYYEPRRRRWAEVK